MKKRKLMLECIETTEGYDSGKSYECLGLSSGYAEVINNSGIAEILPDKYFKIGKKKKSGGDK
jgi:hypothetical protein